MTDDDTEVSFAIGARLYSSHLIILVVGEAWSHHRSGYGALLHQSYQKLFQYVGSAQVLLQHRSLVESPTSTPRPLYRAYQARKCALIIFFWFDGLILCWEVRSQWPYHQAISCLPRVVKQPTIYYRRISPRKCLQGQDWERRSISCTIRTRICTCSDANTSISGEFRRWFWRLMHMRYAFKYR